MYPTHTFIYTTGMVDAERKQNMKKAEVEQMVRNTYRVKVGTKLYLDIAGQQGGNYYTFESPYYAAEFARGHGYTVVANLEPQVIASVDIDSAQISTIDGCKRVYIPTNPLSHITPCKLAGVGEGACTVRLQVLR